MLRNQCSDANNGFLLLRLRHMNNSASINFPRSYGLPPNQKSKSHKMRRWFVVVLCKISSIWNNCWKHNYLRVSGAITKKTFSHLNFDFATPCFHNVGLLSNQTRKWLSYSSLDSRQVKAFIHNLTICIYVYYSYGCPIIDSFCRIRRNSDIRFERVQRGSGQSGE